MLEQVILDRDVRLRFGPEAGRDLSELFSRGRGKAEVIGRSEAHREILGFVVGSGSRRVSLVAGNHSDEPVGPETLRCLLEALGSSTPQYSRLLEEYTFVVVPQTNPDGEAKNGRWIERWPDAEAYLEHAFRELPGRDMEFAFPDGRVENRAVAEFLRRHGPFHLHGSLHGMGFSDGAFLLIERRWGFRTGRLQTSFRALAAEAGLDLHDHNRQGEKGFFYLGPGFNTTPEGEAMRTYFRARDDDSMAKRFRMSSMEYVRSLGGDPLCLVTEMPLFLIRGDQPSAPGRPGPYLSFLERVRDVRGSSDAIARRKLLDDFGVRPLDRRTAMRIQLGVIESGLEAVR
jgi:hypothetical protein